MVISNPSAGRGGLSRYVSGPQLFPERLGFFFFTAEIAEGAEAKRRETKLWKEALFLSEDKLTEEKTRLYLTRHGEVVNHGVYNGQTDVDITPLGVGQMERLRDLLCKTSP